MLTGIFSGKAEPAERNSYKSRKRNVRSLRKKSSRALIRVVGAVRAVTCSGHKLIKESGEHWLCWVSTLFSFPTPYVI